MTPAQVQDRLGPAARAILRDWFTFAAAVAGPAWDVLEHTGAFEAADALERATGWNRPSR